MENMKIAFMGSCQLTQIGMLMNELIKSRQLDYHVLWLESTHNLSKIHRIPLFNALSNADVIYSQYYDEQWGMFSSKRVQKYFDRIKFVPMLESIVSSPQLGYWSKSGKNSAPDFGGYIDFRLLHFYCKGIPCCYAAKMYSDIKPNMKAVQIKIDESVSNYKKYYSDKWVCFDYSERYKTAISDDIECFVTINHPKNKELNWLMNCILSDLGIDNVSIQCPELFRFEKAPSLYGGESKHFVIGGHHCTVECAAKLYYSYFDSFDRKFLEDELLRSDYYFICVDGLTKSYYA